MAFIWGEHAVWRSRSKKRESLAPCVGQKVPERLGKIGVTSMKRLVGFPKAALKVTLSVFVWLFRVVFKWVM